MRWSPMQIETSIFMCPTYSLLMNWSDSSGERWPRNDWLTDDKGQSPERERLKMWRNMIKSWHSNHVYWRKVKNYNDEGIGETKSWLSQCVFQDPYEKKIKWHMNIRKIWRRTSIWTINLSRSNLLNKITDSVYFIKVHLSKTKKWSRQLNFERRVRWRNAHSNQNLKVTDE